MYFQPIAVTHGIGIQVGAILIVGTSYRNIRSNLTACHETEFGTAQFRQCTVDEIG